MKLEIELDLPQDLVDQIPQGGLQDIFRTEVVVRLFADRKIPSGLATRLLGLTRVQFLELLKQRGIAHTDYTYEDWREDTKVMEQFLTEESSPPGDERSLR